MLLNIIILGKKDLIDNLKIEFIESIESQKANLIFSKNNY